MEDESRHHRETDDLGHDVIRVDDAVDPRIEREIAVRKGPGKGPERDPRSHPHAIAKLVHPQRQGVDERLPKREESDGQQEIHEK